MFSWSGYASAVVVNGCIIVCLSDCSFFITLSTCGSGIFLPGGHTDMGAFV